MPYNTNAIPPRKEATGQTQLPLSRVKKIVGQDPDVAMCSNNAAFVITLATEMFIQHLATEGLNCAKLERKPRRNIQYKDIANAISHQDNLEFLSDMVPKTVPFKKVKAQATATRSALDGAGDGPAAAAAAMLETAEGKDKDKGAGGKQQQQTNGGGSSSKKHKANPAAPPPPRSSLNGSGGQQKQQKQKQKQGGAAAAAASEDEGPADPSDQLQLEMQQAHGEGDVEMTG